MSRSIAQSTAIGNAGRQALHGQGMVPSTRGGRRYLIECALAVRTSPGGGPDEPNSEFRETWTIRAALSPLGAANALAQRGLVDRAPDPQFFVRYHSLGARCHRPACSGVLCADLCP